MGKLDFENRNVESYFTYGNLRIHVIEHFALNGKNLEQLLTESVIQKAKELEEKMA